MLRIDPDRGKSLAEIHRYYKEALYPAMARDAAEYEISDRVKGSEVLKRRMERREGRWQRYRNLSNKGES